MMTKLKTACAILCAALSLAAGQAGAVSFEGATGSAANGVTDYSTGTQLSFDLDIHNLTPLTLNFRIEAADLLAPEITFNSLVRNLTGLGFPKLNVKLAGASFAAPAGTVTTDGFATASVTSGTTSIAATFSPVLTSEFYIGNPLGVAGATDWTLNLAGRQAGDTFTLTVAVPEPEAIALAAVGVVIAGVAARRRRQQA